MRILNDRFFSLRLFARVARSGGFAIAGREIGISQPTASRIVAAREKQIGVAILVRTTRAVSLTEAGSDYLARIKPILTALEATDYAARGTGELHGILRVSGAIAGELGVAAFVVPESDVEATASLLATRLSDGPTRSYATVRTLLKAWAAGGVPGADSVLLDVTMPLHNTEDARRAHETRHRT